MAQIWQVGVFDLIINLGKKFSGQKKSWISYFQVPLVQKDRRLYRKSKISWLNDRVVNFMTWLVNLMILNRDLTVSVMV